MKPWKNRHVALLAVFVFAVIIPYAISSFILTGDPRDSYLPLEDFYRSELRHLRLPFWDAQTALGFPVLASAQIGFWYPPLFVLRFLAPEPALAVAYVAHLLVLALGTFRYSRSLGISPAGALIASMAFTGSGFTIGHLPHANILFGIAWLPWALLLTDKLARDWQPRSAVLLSLTAALSALAGHFQVTFMILAFCGVRLMVKLRVHQRGVSWQHTLWTFVLLFGPVALGVLLLSAAQLFPTLELLAASSRGGGFDIVRANQHSFPPWQAVTFLAPAFFGFPDLSEYWGTRPQIEMAAWIGTIPLLLALVGIVGKRGQAFWIATAVFGFLLALGRWSPVRLLGIEPTLGIFSGPARYLVFTEFALALLAGVGLDRLRDVNSETRKRGMRVAGYLGLLSALAIGGGFLLVRTSPETIRRLGVAAVDRLVIGKPEHVLGRSAYMTKVDHLLDRLGTWGVNLGNPLIALSFALTVAGGLVLILGSRGNAFISGNTFKSRAVSGGLVVVTVFELVMVAWRVHPRVPWPEAFRKSPVVTKLQQQQPPGGRLYVVHPQGDTGLLFANPTTENRDEHERLLRDLAVTNIFTRGGPPASPDAKHLRAGISGIEWPAALDFADAAAVLGTMRDDQGRPVNASLLDRLGVRYVAGSTATPNLVLPPPARELLAFGSGDGAVVRLWERPTARSRVELLSELPRDISATLPGVAGTATIATEHPQRVTITVENPSGKPAALVLRDTFSRGWRATLDDAPVAIERADTLFRGVTVPPGTHEVNFTYHPWAAYAGIGTSAAAWLAAAGFLARRRHAQRATLLRPSKPSNNRSPRRVLPDSEVFQYTART